MKGMQSPPSEDDLQREVRAHFEGAFDAAPVGMAMVDATRAGRGTMRRVNAALAALLGVPAEQLVGRQALDLMHPDDREEADTARVAGPTDPSRVTLRLCRADGTYVSTEITTTLLGPSEQRSEYMLAVVVDTSARRLAEERLRASEERFRTMVESSCEGVCAFDVDGRVAFVNPSLAEMLDSPAHDLIGAPAATGDR